MPSDWTSLTVEAQAANPASMLSLYRSALRLRREHQALGRGELRWVATGAPGLIELDMAGDGEAVRVLVNFGASPIPLPRGACLLSSVELDDGHLRAEAAAWILLPA